MSNQKRQKKKKPKKKKLILPDSRVLKLYSNLHNQTALSSLKQFAASFKEPLDLVALEESLSKIPAYSRHRRVRRRAVRPSLITREPRQYYCSDLAIMDHLKHYNKNYSYILVTQDMFSKLLSAIPTKKKTGKVISQAIKLSFKQLKGSPANYLTDNGSEYISGESKRVYRESGVNHIISKTNAKSFSCEVMIKILKEQLYKYMTLNQTNTWIDVLDLIVRKLNTRKHSATGIEPAKVTMKHSGEIFSHMYRRIISKPRPAPKYSVNDLVRISSKRLIFSKAYKPGYSFEIFRITKIVPSWPVFTYKLTDLEGTPLESSFIESELSFVEHDQDGTRNIQHNDPVK